MWLREQKKVVDQQYPLEIYPQLIRCVFVDILSAWDELIMMAEKVSCPRFGIEFVTGVCRCIDVLERIRLLHFSEVDPSAALAAAR
jgi:hypothetical protein